MPALLRAAGLGAPPEDTARHDADRLKLPTPPPARRGTPSSRPTTRTTRTATSRTSPSSSASTPRACGPAAARRRIAPASARSSACLRPAARGPGPARARPAQAVRGSAPGRGHRGDRGAGDGAPDRSRGGRLGLHQVPRRRRADHRLGSKERDLRPMSTVASESARVPRSHPHARERRGRAPLSRRRPPRGGGRAHPLGGPVHGGGRERGGARSAPRGAAPRLRRRAPAFPADAGDRERERPAPRLARPHGVPGGGALPRRGLRARGRGRARRAPPRRRHDDERDLLELERAGHERALRGARSRGPPRRGEPHAHGSGLPRGRVRPRRRGARRLRAAGGALARARPRSPHVRGDAALRPELLAR